MLNALRSHGPLLRALALGASVVAACDATSTATDASDAHEPVDSSADARGEDSAMAIDAASESDAAPLADAGAPSDGGDASDARGDVVLPCGDRVVASAPGAIAAVHHHGQTFVTWADRGSADAGAGVRYDVYRAAEPITDATLARATRVARGVLNHSGQLFGTAFNAAQRLNPTPTMSTIVEGGEPLPPWSGLAVHTAKLDQCAYYAVIATNTMGVAIESVQPGVNATTDAIGERLAPRAPIKLYDSASRGVYSPSTRITGVADRPLDLMLHASNAQGGGAGDYGDYYLYFADETMGYVDGMPGVFSVEETHDARPTLWIRNRDTIVNPNGISGTETYWFGYATVPQWAPMSAPRAYPFTERRLDWIVSWVIDRYRADRNRVTCGGGSMGAWGTTSYCFRRPAIFAAVYADRPRTRQTGLPNVALAPALAAASAVMDDGTTPYLTRMDAVRYAQSAEGELPFYGFGCGRRDGFATWQEQIDMVRALTRAHRGFSFAWNNGDHSVGSSAISRVREDYPPSRFALNESYPAFGNSSLDDDLGNGDPANGALEGGINLGFRWQVTEDSDRRWLVTLSNRLATREITVDVTPRRAQRFRLRAGATVRWTSSVGDSGSVLVDSAGLATIERVRIPAGQSVVLTLTAS